MAGHKAFSFLFVALFAFLVGCSDVGINRYVTETIYIEPESPELIVQTWEQPEYMDGIDIIFSVGS